MKEYRELTLQDNFMFCKIMSSKPELCRGFLERMIGLPISQVKLPAYEKTIAITPTSKTVRLDVQVDDAEGTVYDLEMQTTNRRNLPKRSRYYQGIIDLNHLEQGEQYNKLPPTIIVFICTFDYYEKGLPKYTFRRRCDEIDDLEMGEETLHVVINLKGDPTQLDSKTRILYDYLNGEDPSDSYTEELDRQVSSARESTEWEEEYMQWRANEMDHEEDLERAKNEGILMGKEEGLREGIEKGMQEGIEKGMQEGIEKGMTNERLDSIHNLMDSLKCSAEQAMDLLKIPVSERSFYITQLNN